MARKLLNITIIGAGHYGFMIAKKYLKKPEISLTGIITRNINKKIPKELADVAFFSSMADWETRYGKPTKDDVFDLCVHENILIQELEKLTIMGAKNFILPKPIALTKNRLNKILEIIKKNKLNIVVSSQWQYATLTQEIAKLYNALKKKEKIKEIKILFGKIPEPERKYHSPITTFLPHILEIVHTSKVLDIQKTSFKIKESNSNKIVLNGLVKSNIRVSIEANLAHTKKEQIMEIYTDKNLKPSIVINFTGIIGKESFIKYPEIEVNRNKHEVKEDVLENMIDKQITILKRKGGRDRMKKYIPIAKKIVEIEKKRPKKIAIIGGGVFGVLSAIEIAKKGYAVDIFEKNEEILLEASLVNQCRIHMGYHYPRDKETAIATLSAEKLFRKTFPNAVVKNDFENYYCLSKENSKTSPEEYIKFCQDIGLPINTEWPKNINISKDHINFCLKVPEKIFDNTKMRERLYSLINKDRKINIYKSTEIISIKERNRVYVLTSKNKGDIKEEHDYDGIINAAYSNVNKIHEMAGLNTPNYQYELCEMVVMSHPWKDKSGIAVMDGPFFGIMPFGFSKNYLMYDVEISVLERTVGKFPNFKKNINYHNKPTNAIKRFNKYKTKIEPYLPQIKNSKYITSLYATRIVLPKRDADDARPTIVSNPAPGFWTIFSGKIATCAPYSKILAEKIEEYFNS